MSHTSSATDPPAEEFLPELRPVTIDSTSPFEEAETIWEIDQTPQWRNDPRYRTSLGSSEETTEEAWSYWFAAIAGVTLAGTVYGLPFFLIGAVFGFCIAGVLSLVLAAPFATAVRTITGSWRHPLAAPCFGGIIGFLSTASVWELLWTRRAGGGIVIFILGPLATTALGQIGGYLTTRRDVAAMLARRADQSRWRISIRAMLVTTAWLAATCASLKGFDLLGPAELVAIGVWLPWQLCLLCIFWAIGGRTARSEPHRREPRFT